MASFQGGNRLRGLANSKGLDVGNLLSQFSRMREDPAVGQFNQSVGTSLPERPFGGVLGLPESGPELSEEDVLQLNKILKDLGMEPLARMGNDRLLAQTQGGAFTSEFGRLPEIIKSLRERGNSEFRMRDSKGVNEQMDELNMIMEILRRKGLFPPNQDLRQPQMEGSSPSDPETPLMFGLNIFGA